MKLYLDMIKSAESLSHTVFFALSLSLSVSLQLSSFLLINIVNLPADSLEIKVELFLAHCLLWGELRLCLST